MSPVDFPSHFSLIYISQMDFLVHSCLLSLIIQHTSSRDVTNYLFLSRSIASQERQDCCKNPVYTIVILALTEIKLWGQMGRIC